MVNVGVVGLGMMGRTHLDAYRNISGARVVAVADRDETRLAGEVDSQGNIPGQSRCGYDLSDATKYTDGMDLIRDPEVDMVDLCLVTPLHAEFAIAALAAGKHVLIEKPLARTSEQAQQIIDAESKSTGMAMCAQCMRFWPGWGWLKQAVDSGRYGQVQSATFRRVGEQPDGTFYRDGSSSGGAALDLHIHDTDFVHHLFGMPSRVTSTGYTSPGGGVDHLTTFYGYDAVPHVVAEGGWVTHKGYPFTMQYSVVFERAAASFDLGRDQKLMLTEDGKPATAIELDPGMGYEYEIAYFIDCIVAGKPPSRSSILDAARSLCILEAELQSVSSGQPQAVKDII
jgi:predicted dehydrogenase